MTYAVDLFAGPGGWDVAAQGLGLRTVGLEFDKWACVTRRAYGLETVEGDVREYGPADFEGATGLIASPPCQTFSMAGKGVGRSALDLVLKCIEEMYWGHDMPEDAFEDERTALVLEPLRWALEAHLLGRPFEWLAFEQVPTVLPVWEAMAGVLRRIGYSVATGNAQAEQYGVPQTRKRAILVARLNGPAALPAPTHSRYYPRNPAQLDAGVEKWVSMAEALGWGMTQRPYPTIACSRTTGGPDKEKVGGSAARAVIYAERDAGRWVSRPEDEQPSEESWAFNRPSTTIVGSFRPDIIAAPGYRGPGDGPRQNAPGSIRVSLEEAAALQSFPVDYPWAGGKGKQFQQIGNAIPPGLAAAVLSVCADLGKE